MQYFKKGSFLMIIIILKVLKLIKKYQEKTDLYPCMGINLFLRVAYYYTFTYV